MEKMSQIVKVLITFFSVDKPRVCIAMIGGNNNQSVAIFFGKVYCYTYSIIKS